MNKSIFIIFFLIIFLNGCTAPCPPNGPWPMPPWCESNDNLIINNSNNQIVNVNSSVNNESINSNFSINITHNITVTDIPNELIFKNCVFEIAVNDKVNNVTLVINNSFNIMIDNGVIFSSTVNTSLGNEYYYLINGFKSETYKVKEYNFNYFKQDEDLRVIGKGLTFGGMILTQDSLSDMKKKISFVKSFGFDRIILIPEWFIFPDYNGIEIKPYEKSSGITYSHHCFSYTINDSDLIELTRYAKSQGLIVNYKPQIDGIDFCSNPDSSRGSTHPNNWNEWVNSYKNFILHYANIAQQENVSLFFVGTELDSAAGSKSSNPNAENDWRNIITEVRNIYSGKIAYSASCFGECWSPKEIEFWDAVDYISIEPYFALTNKNNPSVSEMKQAFDNKLDLYAKSLSEEYNKPIILGEVNAYSFDGVNKDPLNGALASIGEVDHFEQADYYESFFESISQKNYIDSYYLWAGYLGTMNENYANELNDKYDPFLNKIAGQVVKKWQE